MLLGLDVGTSSIKASVIDEQTLKTIASVQFPEMEREIISHQQGWAEQSPMLWWQDVQQAILKLNATKLFNPKYIKAIGISYQMHGLVCVDKNNNVLRDAIIWCDSRAVPYGNTAFEKIGEEKCLSHLLNSPGNFTAAKLAWVKDKEPEIFSKVDKIMLPGDFIAMQLTGEISTTASALSEGIFWDFKENKISDDVLNAFGFSKNIIPEIKPVFAEHGKLSKEIAEQLQLQAGIPVAYKAGDQPNNALSLNVLQHGEVAATAGTSGVVYAVSKNLFYDNESRVNSFAHVNYTEQQKNIGILLCINGAGISNRWAKNNFAQTSYVAMNEAMAKIPAGSEGVKFLPFGNGAERILNNRLLQSHIGNIDLNKHTQTHIMRAMQEGVAFAFRYGLDIMKASGWKPSVIRAGKANMFLSDVFVQAFVNVSQVPLEMYESDGSVGAAIGAGLGAKIFKSEKDAFINFKPLKIIEPKEIKFYDELYGEWKMYLERMKN